MDHEPDSKLIPASDSSGLPSLVESTPTQITPEMPLSQTKGPWGFWATIAVSVTIFGWALAFYLVSLEIYHLYLKSIEVSFADERIMDFSKWALAGTYTFSIGLIILSAKFRRTISVRCYLGLEKIHWKIMMLWILLATVYHLIIFTAFEYSGGDSPTGQTVDSYTDLPILLTFYLLLFIAPVFEELLFRGFIFPGIAASRLGPIAAILITSVVWAGIHLPPIWWMAIEYFVVGIMLGLSRHLTGSVIPSIGMHMVGNLWSCIKILLFKYGLDSLIF